MSIITPNNALDIYSKQSDAQREALRNQNNQPTNQPTTPPPTVNHSSYTPTRELTADTDTTGLNDWEKSVVEAKKLERERAKTTPGIAIFSGTSTKLEDAKISDGKGGFMSYSDYIKSTQPTNQPQNPNQDIINNLNNLQKQNNDFARQQLDLQRQQQDAWTKRQEEMQNNMRRMQAEEPQFMKDRGLFEKMTGYEGKSEQERKVVDEFWNNANIAKTKNAGEYYNDIKNGVQIQGHERNRPEYIQAEQTHARIQKYKSMTSGQLANLFKNGELTSGDLALLSKENPDLAHAIAFTNSLNNSGKVNFEQDQMNMSNEIIKNWFTDLKNDERQSFLANALSGDTNIANAMADTKRKADKLGELQKTVLSISQDVDKELEGKNVSRAYAEALKAKRSTQIHTAIASAQIDYSNAMNYQRDLIENKKYDIDYQRTLENRKFQLGQTLYMGRENIALGLQKAQAEFEQKIAQEESVRNNPKLATQAMIDSYRKQGIYAQRSDAEIVADIEQKVASGIPIGQALTELNKAFQGKQEFQTLMRVHNGQMSETEKIQSQQDFALKQAAINHQYGLQERAIAHQYGLQNMAAQNQYDIQNTLMKYNLEDEREQKKAIKELAMSGQMSSAEAQATMRNLSGNWDGANGAQLLFAEDGTFIKSTMYTAKTGTNKKGGIECAEYISRMTGQRVGSTWEEKKKLNPEKTGKIGSIMVWQPSKTGAFAKYGHAGIIIGEEGNNWIVKNANYGVDGKISTIKVPKNTAGAQYRSTNLLNSIQAQKAQGTNTPSVSPEAQHWLNVINKGELDLSTALTKIGNSKESMALKNEIITAMNGQGGRTVRPANDPAVIRMGELAQKVGNLAQNQNQINNVAGSVQWANLNFINNEKSDYLANVQQILEDKTLQEIVDRKNAGATFGALSDTELKALQSASSVLAGAAKRDDKGRITGFNLSEGEFKRQLQVLQNGYLRAQQQMTGGIHESPQNSLHYSNYSMKASNGKNYF